MSDDEIRLKDLRRIRLEPGDVLVVRTEQPLRSWQIEAIRDRLQALFADHEVVVLAPGFDLEVVQVVS